MEKPESAAPEPDEELSEEEMNDVSGGVIPSSSQGGTTLDIPDVTKTPSGGLPTPLPYPNTGTSGDSSAKKDVKTGG